MWAWQRLRARGVALSQTVQKQDLLMITILIFQQSERVFMGRASIGQPVWCAVLAALSATAQAQSTAQSAPDSTTATLGAVVVTATGFEQQVEQAPASISVIQGEALRQRSFRDLTDALRDVEGVVVNGGSNETDISIRGMPSDYTLILVDGKRQGLRDARVNGNRGYEQSFVPPAQAIERIEVVRGPMSSLYGSDAIGGVINIITRKVPKAWGGGARLGWTTPRSSTASLAMQRRDSSTWVARSSRMWWACRSGAAS